MTIIKVCKHERDFTILFNSTIRDNKLSFKARGIHHLLLSYPSEWKVNVKHLENQSDRDGRDAIRSGLKELEDLGYLVKNRKRGNDGKLEGYDYEVHELPTATNGKPVNGDSTTDGLTVNGLTVNGKPVDIRRTKSTKDLSEEINKEPSSFSSNQEKKEQDDQQTLDGNPPSTDRGEVGPKSPKVSDEREQHENDAAPPPRDFTAERHQNQQKRDPWLTAEYSPFNRSINQFKFDSGFLSWLWRSHLSKQSAYENRTEASARGYAVKAYQFDSWGNKQWVETERYIQLGGFWEEYQVYLMRLEARAEIIPAPLDAQPLAKPATAHEPARGPAFDAFKQLTANLPGGRAC